MRKKSFIAFPRSGSHFFNALVKSYLDKHPREIYGHYHYKKNDLKNTIYLWRNPADTIYSFYIAEHIINNSIILDKNSFDPLIIHNMIDRLKNHYKYFRDADIVISYNKITSGDQAEWQKVFIFLNIEFDEKKLENSLLLNSKKSLINKVYEEQNRSYPYMNLGMLSKNYSDNRNLFRSLFGERILSEIAEYLMIDTESLSKNLNLKYNGKQH